MKKLTHDEWQLIVKEEYRLLHEHLMTSRQHGKNKTSAEFQASLLELDKLKEGGSTCLGCILDKSLPH